MDLDTRLRHAGQLLDEAAETSAVRPRPDQRPHQRFRAPVIATVAAAAAALIVLAATAWLPDRDDVVVASEDTRQAKAVPAPSELPADVTVEAAVPRMLPGYTFSEKQEHPGNGHPMTIFEFENDSGVELELTIYTFFSGAEMEQQPDLATGSPENKAWLGADDADLRSVYLVSHSTNVGLRLGSSTAGGGEMLDVEDLLLVAERLVELPAAIATAQGESWLDPGPPTSLGSGAVVWPNQTTPADRTSAEGTVRSFVTEVVGENPTEVSLDQTAPAEGPVWADVTFAQGDTSVLVVPTEAGWVVMQVGEGAGSVRTDPPTLHLPSVPHAESVQVRIDTPAGIREMDVEADELSTGVPLPDGTVHSVVATYRDSGGNVLAVHGGHY